MKSKKYAACIRSKIDLDMTHNISYYTNLTAEPSHSFETSHVSVLSQSGDAVSVTSSINYYYVSAEEKVLPGTRQWRSQYYHLHIRGGASITSYASSEEQVYKNYVSAEDFGSLVISYSTGIIWNNAMADFTFRKDKISPVTYKANKVEPLKKPLSSMAPMILTDKKGNVTLVNGAAGGSKIINIVMQILVRVLWLNQTLAEAIDAKRISHILIPNVLDYEYGMSKDVEEEQGLVEILGMQKEMLNQLEAKGHQLTSNPHFLTVVEGILVKDG